MSLLEEIYNLSAEESKVLHSEIIDEQLIEVREYAQYRWLQIGGDSIQGLMDVHTASQILLPNIQALMVSLLLSPAPAHVLNLGLGCGSIERFMQHHYRDSNVTSLESNAAVIRLAKSFFFVADEINIVNSSAERFLASDKTFYDIIFCDIFNDEAHPACLYEDHFYADIFSCLDNKGVLAINLLPEDETDVLKILSPMKNYFDSIALLEVPSHFNVVIYASNQRLPGLDELETAAQTLFNNTQLDLSVFPSRINRLMESVVS